MAITALIADFPKEVWLGKISGQWPVYAFSDEKSALRWAAAEVQPSRYILGPIDIDLDVEVRKAKTVPAEAQWD